MVWFCRFWVVAVVLLLLLSILARDALVGTLDVVLLVVFLYYLDLFRQRRDQP